MRHLSPSGSGLRLCQLCEFANRQPVRFAKTPFVSLYAGRRLAKLPTDIARRPNSSRLFATSAPCLKAKRTRATLAPQNEEPRFVGRKADQPEGQLGTADLAKLATAVDHLKKTFLDHPGIPSEEVTLIALRNCADLGTRLTSDAQDLPSEEPESSHLLHLDPAGSTQGSGALKATQTNATPSSTRPQDLVGKISDAAYEIITYPAVVITPQVLSEYVGLQARLGKPESLPQVLELYATKPKPRLVNGSIQYVEQNPDMPNKAIDASIVEKALDAAIEARNLDVAVGVVESTYATKASRRLRLLLKALLPAGAVALTPVLVYLIASKLAVLQNTMDQYTATNVAFAAILAYVGFTATIGAVAVSTANDQMRRVTWAPGIPLRHRWLRENERAAFDKIACGFGFSEVLRHGEEQGEEFQLLREFLLRRGMILDAVELMPGMT
ncbi:hypothetical protein QBC47DRAFT_340205 [Echria macrotheca]|uniref:Uncharacterized protein n=1 Tax=Echria macrotheca TaxID=438768 RepID=A0AAJ0BFS8_9PEZI|nr:hypothetical protein QBC47DRAFT_340205 [Echria macrotheca]